MVKKYVVVISIYFVLVSVILVISDSLTVRNLGKEDGLFEYLTAFYFLLASLLFYLSFRKKRPDLSQTGTRPAARFFFLILSIVFLLGSGEEVSWGQRIFHYKPPEIFMKTNVQKEANLHNLGLFNITDKNNQTKSSFMIGLTTIAGLFFVFTIVYGFIIPLMNRYLPLCRRWLQKIRLPIAPIELGLFFILNWIIYRALKILGADESPEYLWSIVEIRESHVAFVFLMIALYFYNSASSLKPIKGS